MQNFEEHKRSDRIKWVAITVVVLLLAVAVSAALTQGFTNANPYGWLDKKTETTPEETNEPETETEAEIQFSDFVENGLMLSVGEAFTASDPDSAFVKTLTATVVPNDAPNKLVDWTIAWCDGAIHGSDNVTNYVTITPNGDGSNVAVVECKKSFEGDYIIVTCTTREGGFSATCRIEYKGYPQTIVINTNGATIKKDANWNKDMLEVGCNKSVSLDLSLDNDIHAVGSSFGNYTLSMDAHGSINLNHTSYNSDGTVTSTSTSTRNPLGGGTNTSTTNGRVYANIQVGSTFDTLLEAKVENGKLVIYGGSAITAISATNYGRGGYATETFGSYVDNKCPYYTITVTETTTGITKTIDVKTVASVTSVSLSQTTLEF